MGFPINPPRVPIADANGMVTPEWYRFFSRVQKSIGGPSDPFDEAMLSSEGRVSAALDPEGGAQSSLYALQPLVDVAQQGYTAPNADTLFAELIAPFAPAVRIEDVLLPAVPAFDFADLQFSPTATPTGTDAVAILRGGLPYVVAMSAVLAAAAIYRASPATLATDANAAITVPAASQTLRHTGTLTADRTLTLTGSQAGSQLLVVRTGSGAFNLVVGGLKNLSQNTWAIAEYDGSAFFLAGYGSL